MFHVPQLKTVTNVNLLANPTVFKPTKRGDIPCTTLKSFEYDIQIGEMILEEYPNSVMFSTIYM